MAPTTPNPASGSAAPSGAPSTTPPATGAAQNPAKPAEAAQDSKKSPTAVAKFASLGGKETRIITAKDLEDNAILDHGVEDDLVWNSENNFVVDVSDLSEEALDFLHKSVEGVTVKRSKQDD